MSSMLINSATAIAQGLEFSDVDGPIVGFVLGTDQDENLRIVSSIAARHPEWFILLYDEAFPTRLPDFPENVRCFGAMACGVPLITASRDSLLELDGDFPRIPLGKTPVWKDKIPWEEGSSVIAELLANQEKRIFLAERAKQRGDTFDGRRISHFQTEEAPERRRPSRRKASERIAR